MAEEEGAVLQGHCADLKRMYCTAGGQGKTCCFLLRTLGAGKETLSPFWEHWPQAMWERLPQFPQPLGHTQRSAL